RMDRKHLVLWIALASTLLVETSISHEPMAPVPADTARTMPVDFASWDVPRKITFLTRALEDVSVPQPFGFPVFGGLDFTEDWRVTALIELGDAAVPALIGVVETVG